MAMTVCTVALTAAWIIQPFTATVPPQTETPSSTREHIALMLAIRRPSVTTALHVLEGKGLIRSVRKLAIMRNQRALEKFAFDAYGEPEKEYRQLFGKLSFGDTVEQEGIPLCARCVGRLCPDRTATSGSNIGCRVNR